MLPPVPQGYKLGGLYCGIKRNTEALDLSLIVSRGDRLGLIGPNGAGKTTLIRLILGTLQADSGTIRLGSNVTPAYFDQMRASLKRLIKEKGLKSACAIHQDDDFGPPLFGDEPTNEHELLSFDDDSGAMPHWTEPATGQVPRSEYSLPETIVTDETDDLDVWSSFSAQADPTGGSGIDRGADPSATVQVPVVAFLVSCLLRS